MAIANPRADIAKAPRVADANEKPNLTIRMPHGKEYFHYASFADFRGAGYDELKWEDRGAGLSEAKISTKWLGQSMRDLVLTSGADIAQRTGRFWVYSTHLSLKASGEAILSIDPNEMSRTEKVELWREGHLSQGKDVRLSVTHLHGTGGAGAYYIYGLPNQFEVHSSALFENVSLSLFQGKVVTGSLELAYADVPMQGSAQNVILGREGYGELALERGGDLFDVAQYIRLNVDESLKETDAAALNVDRLRIALPDIPRPLSLYVSSTRAKKPLVCQGEPLTTCAIRALGNNYGSAGYVLDASGTFHYALYDYRAKKLLPLPGVTSSSFVPGYATLVASDRAYSGNDYFSEQASQASNLAFASVGLDAFQYKLEKYVPESQKWEVVRLKDMVPNNYAFAMKWLKSDTIAPGTYRFTREFKKTEGFVSRSVLDFKHGGTRKLFPSLSDLAVQKSGDVNTLFVRFNGEDAGSGFFPPMELVEVRAGVRAVGESQWTEVPLKEDVKLFRLFVGAFKRPVGSRFEIEIVAKDADGNTRTTTASGLL